MNEYERKTANPFTLSFGAKPKIYIKRTDIEDKLISGIKSSPSTNFVITGVRASGKTVMLTVVSQYFDNQEDWLVIDLNPLDDLITNFETKLMDEAREKGICIKGDIHSDGFIDVLFKEIQAQKKRILITIDETTNSRNIKNFLSFYKGLLEKEYPVALLLCGIYENVSFLEKRPPLIHLKEILLPPLNIRSMAHAYQQTLDLSDEEALKSAKLTKGYAFAFQLLGYLMFAKNKKEIDKEVLSSYDQYLEDYSYAKIWFALSEVERKIVMSFQTNSSIPVSTILERAGMKKEYFSRYRDRLIKKGILVSPMRGKLMFNLPRFKEFIDVETAYDF